MTKQTITAQQVKDSVSFTYFCPGIAGEQKDTKFEKLTAAEQRSLFLGFAPFGRKSIKVVPTGVSTSIQVAYGQDFDIQDYTWEEIAKMIQAKRKNWKNGYWTVDGSEACKRYWEIKC